MQDQPQINQTISRQQAGFFRPVWLFFLLFILVGYRPSPEGLPAKDSSSSPQITVEEIPLREPPQPCSGTFVPHTLDHVTSVPGGDEVRMFEANGAGVAINDLDNDGDLDIVLTNHRDPNTILWNDGNLTFYVERMPYGDSRAVNVVDVDGDGWLDLVLTRRMSGPNYWHNTGGVEGLILGENEPRFAHLFTQELLPGISQPAYAMNWADLDGDGDLDLVTGSYDASLLIYLGNNFLFGGGAGVFYHENRAGKFISRQLAPGAQAMAIALLDLDGDDRLDILVGNDFAVPDQAWVRQGESWVATSPFAATSHSTMSLDWGDINNEGRFALFSTDMKPYDNEPDTVAAWQPLMADMSHPPMTGDPQIMENVLQLPTGRGQFNNEAPAWGLDATGWSWSAKFGDLNNDGFLDLYVVNGMIEFEMFAHLPNHELVEKNQVLSNSGYGHFRPVPEWGLSSTRSGRGMSMADLDQDGDLDIVINNLRGPAQLFENRLCGGASLQVDLFWPGSSNTRAIGAILALYTDRGTYYRDVRVASGYLSGDPARVHFGFPPDTTLHHLEIRWPDGLVSPVEPPSPQTRLNVMRR